MSQPRPDPTRDAPERAWFFDRQLVRPADLNQDQAYFLDEFRRHTRLLHGWGIRLGLGVDRVPDEPARRAAGPARDEYDAFLRRAGIDRVPEDVPPDRRAWVLVEPGYAVSPVGDRLYLPRAVFINTTQERPDGTLVTSPVACVPATGFRTLTRDGEPYYLVVEGWQDETGAVRASAGRCGDHPDQFEFSRVADTLRFRLVRADEVKDPFPAADKRDLLSGTAKRSFVCLGSVTFETREGRRSVKVGMEVGSDGDRRDPELCVPVCPEPAAKPRARRRRMLSPLWVAFVVVIVVMVILFAWLAFSGPSKPKPPERADGGGGSAAPADGREALRTGRPALTALQWVNVGDQRYFLQDGRTEEISVPWVDDPAMGEDPGGWARGAGFSGRLLGPATGDYSVTGYMAASNDYLYLTGHVRDPYPGRNWRGLSNDLSEVYRGGSVTVHLAASSSPLTEGDKKRPDLIHLQIWSAEDRAQLQVALGNVSTAENWNKHQRADDSPDTRRFDWDPDGRGYWFRYRIPWSTLRPTVQQPRPQRGETWWTCWDVHWSDSNGNGLVAKLTDIVNLDAVMRSRPFDHLAYDNPQIWGKAVFQK